MKTARNIRASIKNVSNVSVLPPTPSGDNVSLIAAGYVKYVNRAARNSRASITLTLKVFLRIFLLLSLMSFEVASDFKSYGTYINYRYSSRTYKYCCLKLSEPRGKSCVRVFNVD